ncbi:MAG: alpha/beta hydrolase [Bacteroidales bacterium]|jgi:pimeloyl-ACP methyl ester carboxylesterase|nr:alpha/beta hydrolase [Bacteroidales bacterium]
MKYYIYFQGGKIYYSERGSGDPVVLLHGYLESSEVWKEFAEKLAGSFRVITIDLPGHGSSAVYSGSHTMEFMAAAVNEVLAGLNVKKAFMIGHSLGGYVTLAFLELYPNILRGYCLFHSHPFADTEETIKKREREIKIVRMGKKYLMYPDNVSMMFASSNLERFKEKLTFLKNVASDISDEGVIAVLNGMMLRPSRLSVMEEGAVPCLWILGRYDNYIQCETIQARVVLPPNAKVVILENSGHLGFIEEKDQSAGIVTAFVKGL